MADEFEEVNEGQALAAMQQLMNQYRAIGKIYGVLARYDQAKLALPDLESRKADLESQLSTLDRNLADLRTHHEASIKDMEAEFQKRKSELTQTQATNAVELDNAIRGLEARKAAKLAAADQAEREAQNRISEADASVKAAQTSADAEIERIKVALSEQRAQHDRLVAGFEAFKKDHGLTNS